MAETPETKLTKKILDRLNKIEGCRAEKLHGNPYGKQKLDLFGAKNGKMFYLEVKVPGNKPTKRQDSTIRKWKDESGALVTWVDKEDEAVKLVQQLL